MHDGDFGADGGSGDEGPLDLNDNGTSLDEFVLFAAITEGQRRRREKATKSVPLRQAQAGGCLLPVFILTILLAGAAT